MDKQIIDLSKQDDISIGDNEAYASLGYNAQTALDFCHGFRFQFGGQIAATAGISRHITEFIKATIEIEAGVEAGMEFTAQVSPNILDQIGLTLSFQAHLKAYIRAKLELALEFETFLNRLITEGYDDSTVVYKVFKEFVDQIEVATGVQANAQIAISAAAQILCTARLFDQGKGREAGFDFRINAEAAFMFGMGVDFFAKIRFANITQFFKNSKDHIIDDIKKQIDKETEIEVPNFVFNSLTLALDMIIDAGVSGDLNRRSLTLHSIQEFLKKFLVDEVIKAYEQLLNKVIEEAIDWIKGNLDKVLAELVNKEVLTDHGKAITFLDSLRTLQKTTENIGNVSSIHDVLPVIEDIVHLLDQIGFEHIETIKSIGTHIYAIGYLIDDENRDKWSHLPAYSTLNINSFNGTGDVYTFLRASCFDDFVIQNTGDTGKVLLDILDNLDEGVLPFSEFMTVIFDEETSGLETQQKMFHIIFTLLENTFDEYVVNTFQENVQSLFNASDSGMAYYDVVLKDTINSFTPIFLPAIKANYINDGNKPTISGSDLAYLSNRFLLVFLAKNVSFMSSEFMSISARNMTSSLKDYRRIVDGNGFNDIAGRFFDAMEDDLNKMLPIPKGATIPMEMKSDLIQATVKFLNDTINVAEIAMGESTWTESRINTLSMAIEKMVANPDENSFDFSSLNANEVKNIINNLQDCDFKPQEDESGKLSTVLQEIGELQFKALLRDMPGYTAEYVVKIAEILLVAGIREILDFLEDIIEKASEKLKKEIDDLIKLLEEIEKQAQELEKFYNEVRKSVESFFDDLIDDVENLQLEGWEKFREGLLEFVDFLIFFADIDTYKENAKQVIERTRRQALNNLDNDAFEQLHLNAKNPNIPKVIYAMKNIEDDVITFRNKIFTDAIIDDLNQQVKPQDKASFLAEIDAKLEIETDINSEDGQKITTKGLLELKFKFNTIRRKENDEDGIHSISSNEDNLAQLQAEKAKIENRKDDSSKTLKESSIKIHSPVPINLIEEKGSNSVETLKFDNLPIFNKYVYLDIDFDKVPIRSIMEHQFQFNLKKMVDYNNVISSRNQKLHAKNHLDNNDGIISLLQVKIILNGHELDLKDFKRERNRLTAHVDESFLLHGNNSLLVLVIPTSLYKEDEFIHHINFFCDLSSKNRPSNGIYIDPEKTVINSQGNDHLDANSTDMSDKEQVAITNNTNKDIVLGGWKLSDAKGHAYEFDDDFTIRSGETVSVIVGESSLKSKSWKKSYAGRLIALLNNNGEFLKLEDSTGKVVSCLYTGNPKSNPDINFLSKPQS